MTTIRYQAVLMSRYVIFRRQRAGYFGLVLNTAENTGRSSFEAHCTIDEASTIKSNRLGSDQRQLRF